MTNLETNSEKTTGLNEIAGEVAEMYCRNFSIKHRMANLKEAITEIKTAENFYSSTPSLRSAYMAGIETMERSIQQYLLAEYKDARKEI